jgi:hypothetical protein
MLFFLRWQDSRGTSIDCGESRLVINAEIACCYDWFVCTRELDIFASFLS